MYKVGIIGLGLIGGSMAIDLRRRGFACEILGVEHDPVNSAAALNIGLADRIISMEECVCEADVTVLAVPVDEAVRLLPEILDTVAEFQSSVEDGVEGRKARVVTDVCSVKLPMVEAVAGHPARHAYVATHPMAGTEYSGPWAAMSGLFDGRACVICDSGDSSGFSLAVIEEMYDTLNMRQIGMSASNHDMHAAYVSHISHVTSFALALTVLEQERNDMHIFDLASGGFSSTVRLAKSSADMWVPVLSMNRDNVLDVIDTYMAKMQEFRDAVAASDRCRIKDLIEESNRIRRIIR